MTRKFPAILGEFGSYMNNSADSCFSDGCIVGEGDVRCCFAPVVVHIADLAMDLRLRAWLVPASVLGSSVAAHIVQSIYSGPDHSTYLPVCRRCGASRLM